MVDLFGDVLLEYGVAYSKDYFPTLWGSGLGEAHETLTMADVVERLSSNPELIEKLSVEQLRSIIAFMTSAAGAG